MTPEMMTRASNRWYCSIVDRGPQDQYDASYKPLSSPSVMVLFVTHRWPSLSATRLTEAARSPFAA